MNAMMLVCAAVAAVLVVGVAMVVSRRSGTMQK